MVHRTGTTMAIRGDLMTSSHWLVALGSLAALVLGGQALAQTGSPARALLEDAAAAMGGLQRLRALDSLVMTGFGQRYATNGNISADPKSPPKWQPVTDAQRYFDLKGKRALESGAQPAACSRSRRCGHVLPTRARECRPASTCSIIRCRRCSQRSMRRTHARHRRGRGRHGRRARSRSPTAAPLRIALDPQTHLPYWARWITG